MYYKEIIRLLEELKPISRIVNHYSAYTIYDLYRKILTVLDSCQESINKILLINNSCPYLLNQNTINNLIRLNENIDELILDADRNLFPIPHPTFSQLLVYADPLRNLDTKRYQIIADL